MFFFFFFNVATCLITPPPFLTFLLLQHKKKIKLSAAYRGILFGFRFVLGNQTERFGNHRCLRVPFLCSGPIRSVLLSQLSRLEERVCAAASTAVLMQDESKMRDL